MRKLKMLSGMLLLSALTLGSVSCSSDDDPGEGLGGGQGTGTCSVEGRTISYNHGYYYKENYGTPGSIELMFTDYDVTTLPDKMVYGFLLSFTTTDTTLPEGTFPYSNSDEDLNTWGFVELYDYNPAQDAASGGDEDLISHGTYTYVTDWNPGYESGNIVITRDGNFYRIELNDLKFLKDANGDDGVDSFEPKASGSFVWEGELKDITSWMNGDEYGRSLSYGSPWNKLSRIAR